MFMPEGKRLPVLQELPVPSAVPSAGVDRRGFLALLGASVALAELPGCTRQPPEKIVPYVRQPEVAPAGAPVFYATSMVHAGYATGLLVRSVTGRPVKIEGNPDHPASLGATDTFAQAALFSLYDPGRAQVITRLGRVTTWSRLTKELAEVTAVLRAEGGAGVHLLTGAVTSPSLAAEIGRFLAELPGARWARFEPAGPHHTRAGAMMAFGAPVDVRYDLREADVLCTLDSELLASGPGSLRYARDFARRRHAGDAGALGHTSSLRGDLPLSPRMNRMYSIESSPTSTGTLADHRLALRPSEVAVFAAVLAAELGVVPEGAPVVPASPLVRRWARAVARDLRASAGRCVVVAGEPCPPAVHALAAIVNEALGNVGKTVLFTEPVEVGAASDLTSLQELTDEMRGGRVRLLVVLEGNPVYTAPADLDFGRAMGRVDLAIHLSTHVDETSERCHYHVPAAHFLEAWGDARAFDGTVSLLQPLLEPLYGGRTALEVVSALRGKPAATSLELVQAHWRAEMGEEGFSGLWERALERGFFVGTAAPPRPAAVVPGAVAMALAAIAGVARTAGSLELAIRVDPCVDDGRHSQNAWLQELPKPQTKQTWENAAWMSPATAAKLGARTGDIVQIARDGRSVAAPALVVRDHADATVTVHLGYGRTTGEVARGLGFDAYRLRTSTHLWHGPGLLVRRVGEGPPLAITQGDFDPHQRPHVRVATLRDLEERPGIVRAMGHAPAPGESLYPPWPRGERQWGMNIDQNVCTGCSACVIACQAENNIPVVGREEVLRGREMHWLRIDRYEVETGGELAIVNQPMMCVHCELAPCEYVCPVEATTHSAEGLNEMTYNRCVGTRYCQNNCPYKVRRFNFLDYHAGDADVVRLGRSPDVTVRSRGVMEKCTYCVQRIAAGRIAAEIEARPVRDGEVVTACQAACPTGAIVFGDVSDPSARVTRMKADPRSYGVLEELGTRPRTTHLARIRNLDPELEDRG